MSGLALVRGLVEWMPSSVTWVGVLAGPLVLLGYLVGSLPFDRVVDHADDTPGVRRTAAAAGLAALAALAVTTLAWDLAMAAAPNSTFSAIGYYANQILPAWASVALWTGMGCVLGHIAPVWRGFRGGSGVPPALALAVVHVPLLVAVGAAAFLLARLAGLTARQGLLVALPTVVAYEYLAWTADWQAGWGLTHGPELGLWTAAVAVALGARNLRPAPA